MGLDTVTKGNSRIWTVFRQDLGFSLEDSGFKFSFWTVGFSRIITFQGKRFRFVKDLVVFSKELVSAFLRIWWFF